MNFETILGNVDFLEFLRGKKATFLLSASVTKTCEISNISQAGIPGKLYLTPTLDAEFLCTKQVKSMPEIAQTPKGVPTPALITRAVHELKSFSNIEILNLGLDVLPKIDYFKIHNFNIKSSGRIDDGAKISALEVFQKGLEFGQSYETTDDYVILAESIPAGTTTAPILNAANSHLLAMNALKTKNALPAQSAQQSMLKAFQVFHRAWLPR
jgi:NaMN:DMB phosphoribosyltransferase